MTRDSKVEQRRVARELALKRLSLREHSTHELETYLVRKEIPREMAAEIIARLIEEKLVDDRRFARAVTRGQAIRDKGPGYILQMLRQKGVCIELDEVREIFAESSDRGEFELARSLVQRRFPHAQEDEKVRSRACAALHRRGFSDEVVRRLLPGFITD